MRATCVELSFSALRHNLQVARRTAPTSRVMAAVKADAYGHGLLRAVKALEQADAFAVESVAEALQVREACVTKPVVLLEGFFHADELDPIQCHQLVPVVHHISQIEILERVSLHASIKVWLKVDSGMHRLGFAPDQVRSAWERLRLIPRVEQLGFLTHLANADQCGDMATTRQLRTFADAVGDLPGEYSIANSAGILAWPASHSHWVRPGIMLYGVSPFPQRTGVQEGLQPVMTLRSELIAVNHLRRGDAVGYGGTWICPEDMPVGVASVGYGDGYPRHACSGTPALVNGKRVPLIGRVSMDMITLDLRSQPHARAGDPVVLWGNELPVEEVAQGADTIAYELLCGVTGRVPRIEVE